MKLLSKMTQMTRWNDANNSTIWCRLHNECV